MTNKAYHGCKRKPASMLSQTKSGRSSERRQVVCVERVWLVDEAVLYTSGGLQAFAVDCQLRVDSGRYRWSRGLLTVSPKA